MSVHFSSPPYFKVRDQVDSAPSVIRPLSPSTPHPVKTCHYLLPALGFEFTGAGFSTNPSVLWFTQLLSPSSFFAFFPVVMNQWGFLCRIYFKLFWHSYWVSLYFSTWPQNQPELKSQARPPPDGPHRPELKWEMPNWAQATPSPQEVIRNRLL